MHSLVNPLLADLVVISDLEMIEEAVTFELEKSGLKYKCAFLAPDQLEGHSGPHKVFVVLVNNDHTVDAVVTRLEDQGLEPHQILVGVPKTGCGDFFYEQKISPIDIEYTFFDFSDVLRKTRENLYTLQFFEYKDAMLQHYSADSCMFVFSLLKNLTDRFEVKEKVYEELASGKELSKLGDYNASLLGLALVHSKGESPESFLDSSDFPGSVHLCYSLKKAYESLVSSCATVATNKEVS